MALLLCDSIGKLCGKTCNCLIGPCQVCCSGTWEAFTSPFFPYLAVTFAFNLPPVVWGLKSTEFGDCDREWLGVNTLLCAVNIVASFYIAHKVQDEKPILLPIAAPATATIVADTGLGSVEDPKSSYMKMPSVQAEPVKPSYNTSSSSVNQNNDEGAPNSLQRLGKVMCYDAGVAVYIIVVVIYMIWQTVGIAKLFGNDSNDNQVCNQIESWQMNSIVCGYIWMMCVCCAFGCSVICLR